MIDVDLHNEEVADSLLNDVVDMYKCGNKLEHIAKTMEIEVNSVVGLLQFYTNSQRKENRTYSDELRHLVAIRDSYEHTTRKEIIEELGVSRNFLLGAVDEYGYVSLPSVRCENTIQAVDDDFNFSSCPICESSRINEIPGLYEDILSKGAYCIDCGNEFVLHSNILYKILWENVD